MKLVHSLENCSQLSRLLIFSQNMLQVCCRDYIHTFFFFSHIITYYRCICFNRCLPMNLTAEDLASGVLRDRVKVGASLADVDPMNLDNSVSGDTD